MPWSGSYVSSSGPGILSTRLGPAVLHTHPRVPPRTRTALRSSCQCLAPWLLGKLGHDMGPWPWCEHLDEPDGQAVRLTHVGPCQQHQVRLLLASQQSGRSGLLTNLLRLPSRCVPLGLTAPAHRQCTRLRARRDDEGFSGCQEEVGGGRPAHSRRVMSVTRRSKVCSRAGVMQAQQIGTPPMNRRDGSMH